jgi:hypothetical protein
VLVSEAEPEGGVRSSPLSWDRGPPAWRTEIDDMTREQKIIRAKVGCIGRFKFRRTMDAAISLLTRPREGRHGP